MSDLDTDQDMDPELEPSRLDDDEIKSLLRQAMRVDRSKPAHVLPEVQRKIRQRSRGRFYGDGWSTGRSPRSTYFITSVVMLVVLVMIYFALVPGGWGIP